MTWLCPLSAAHPTHLPSPPFVQVLKSLFAQDCFAHARCTATMFPDFHVTFACPRPPHCSNGCVGWPAATRRPPWPVDTGRPTTSRTMPKSTKYRATLPSTGRLALPLIYSSFPSISDFLLSPLAFLFLLASLFSCPLLSPGELCYPSLPPPPPILPSPPLYLLLPFLLPSTPLTLLSLPSSDRLRHETAAASASAAVTPPKDYGDLYDGGGAEYTIGAPRSKIFRR